MISEFTFRGPPRVDESSESRRVAQCPMFYAYILLSEVVAKTYVGSTVDIEKRVTEHNSGKSTFTKRYTPWKLIYVEQFDSLQKARTREKYLKTAAGRAFMKKHIPRWRSGSAGAC